MCPKMIGSETFIIVALRCAENSTPSSFARWICSRMKVCSAETDMNVASTTSPARTGMPSLSTVVPSGVVRRIVRESSDGRTTDFSFEKKSPAPIVATFVRDSGDQAPMRCGCALA